MACRGVAHPVFLKLWPFSSHPNNNNNVSNFIPPGDTNPIRYNPHTAPRCYIQSILRCILPTQNTVLPASSICSLPTNISFVLTSPLSSQGRNKLRRNLGEAKEEIEAVRVCRVKNTNICEENGNVEQQRREAKGCPHMDHREAVQPKTIDREA